jgi:hypothetical protein
MKKLKNIKIQYTPTYTCDTEGLFTIMLTDLPNYKLNKFIKNYVKTNIKTTIVTLIN